MKVKPGLGPDRASGWMRLGMHAMMWACNKTCHRADSAVGMCPEVAVRAI